MKPPTRLRLTVSQNVYDMALETADGVLLPASRVELRADVREGVAVVATIPADMVDFRLPLTDDQSWYRHGDVHDDPGGSCARCSELDR